MNICLNPNILFYWVNTCHLNSKWDQCPDPKATTWLVTALEGWTNCSGKQNARVSTEAIFGLYKNFKKIDTIIATYRSEEEEKTTQVWRGKKHAQDDPFSSSGQICYSSQSRSKSTSKSDILFLQPICADS